MAILLDSTALIDILEENPGIELLLNKLEGESVFTSRLNVFEILVRVYSLERNTEKKRNQAEQLFSRLNILELNEAAVNKAAQIQGLLYKQGKPIDDIDCLTAAIALMSGVTKIATRNVKYFGCISGIIVERY